MPQATSVLVTPEQVLKSLGALPEADRYVAALGIYRSGRKELLAGIFSLRSSEAEELFIGTLEAAGRNYKNDGASFAYNVGRKETAAGIYDSIGDNLSASRVWKEAGNFDASRKSFLRAIEEKKKELSRALSEYDANSRAEEIVKLEREFGSLVSSPHILIGFLRDNRQYEISAKVLEELGCEEDAKQDLRKAAELAEIKDNLSAAADLFEKVGMPDRAKEILIKCAMRHEMKGEYCSAAIDYKRVGDLEKATGNWRKHVQQLKGTRVDLRYDRSNRDPTDEAVKAAAEWGLSDLALEICMESKRYGQGAKFAEALGEKEKAEALKMLDELTSRMD